MTGGIAPGAGMCGWWPTGIPEHYHNNIVAGDALSFISSLPPASVPMFLFSPPYNLSARADGIGGFPNRGHYPADARMGARGGAGKWKGAALADGYTDHDDAMPPAEYAAWQRALLSACWAALSDTGAIYYQHKPRVLNGIVQTPLDFVPGLPVRQIVIWARAGGINFSPSFYCPTHEWIVVIAKPAFRLRDKAASGAGDVWYIPQESSTWHPAPFPLALAMTALETVRPAFVVDPFCGSGTTAKAAKSLGIGWIGNDKSAEYVARANAEVAAMPEPLFTQPPAVQVEMAL